VSSNSYSDSGLAAGTYYYRVTAVNQLNHESSASAQTFANVPAIAVPPQSQTLTVGQTVQFTVSATGLQPLTYQWRAGATNGGPYTNMIDGGQVSGAVATNLTISNVTSNNIGNYFVVVSNSFGSVTSSMATLLVIVLPSGTNFTMQTSQGSGADWNSTNV